MSENSNLNWIKIKENEFVSHLDSCQNNQKIYLKKWQKNSQSKLVLFLFHDFCQYSGAFKNFIDWCLKNLNDPIIYTMDYIGHGQSSGTRGHIECFDNLITDQFNFISKVENDKKQRVVYIGHGLGGLVTIDMYNRFGSRLNRKPDKLVFTNFILNLDHFVFHLGFKHRNILNNFVKHLRLKKAYEMNKLIVSTDKGLMLAQDPFMVAGPTLNSVIEIKRKMKSIYQDAYYLDLPIFVGWSDHDPYLYLQGVRYFIKGVKKEFLTEKTYSLMKHDLYNELDSYVFFNDLKNWI